MFHPAVKRSRGPELKYRPESLQKGAGADSRSSTIDTLRLIAGFYGERERKKRVDFFGGQRIESKTPQGDALGGV